MKTRQHTYFGYFLVVLIFFILAAVYLAVIYGGLFENFFWYDMILHFFGGAWVAGMAFWYLSPHLGMRSPSGGLSLGDRIPKLEWVILLSVFIVGIGWEIFEIIVNTATNTDWYSYIDGASDIFFDMVGAFAMWFFIKYFLST